MRGPGEAPTIEERPIPSPGPLDVVVRVRACSLNYHDLVNLAGLIKGPWPRVPLSDGAGDVVAVGSDVTAWKPGDRVFGAFFPRWQAGPARPEAKRVVYGDTCDGWLQQYVWFPADALVEVPAGLTFEEAATLPCAATTAWSALRAGEVRPGSSVVVQGSGGVSVFALQLAKAHGATVIATSSSDDKLATLSELGADHLVNYRREPDWDRRVRELVPGGADVVVDVGGPETLSRSIAATRMGGTIAVVGVLSGYGDASVPVGVVMTRHLRLTGVAVGSVADHRDVAAAVASAGLRPHISHVFDWTELAEATRVMHAREHLGKVVIRVP
ncbi:MAG TPA: NAD(P)-dependent alcohol dehydrogenase [Acidimicrobiales bacterium]